VFFLFVLAGFELFFQLNPRKFLLSATKTCCFVVKIILAKREQKFYDMHVGHSNIIHPEQIIIDSGLYLAVLPKLVSLDLALDTSSSAVSKFQSMSHDLASGLQFMHDLNIAHMDIKPSNLVYHPATFVLQVIDFNSVIWVKNLDETISGRRGTLAWMAPGLCIPYTSRIRTNLVFQKCCGTYHSTRFWLIDIPAVLCSIRWLLSHGRRV
jgi:serine/threonine protein kinase